MTAPKTRDYFAEMYIAGVLADKGWNVYFPKRDKGFDMIATKNISGTFILRPIQVKGKYPTDTKKAKKAYGINNKLSETHNEMVLAIPYFETTRIDSPVRIAWMPFSKIRKRTNGKYLCGPAQYKDGKVSPRRDYAPYFDDAGLKNIENKNWK